MRFCPWCYVSPYLRPPNHPSLKSETELFGTVVSETISTRVTEALVKHQQEYEEKANARVEKLESLLSKVEPQQKAAPMPPLPSKPPPLKKNPTRHIERYFSEFLTDEDSKGLMDLVEKIPYTEVRGRGVASYGEPYAYNGAPKAHSKDIPKPILDLIEKCKKQEGQEKCDINEVIVNRYKGAGSFLVEHSDAEENLDPKSLILTVSLGSTRTVTFRDYNSTEGREESLSVAGKSLYSMTKSSQHHWSHRIDADPDIEEVRYSITLRTVGERYRQSTVIIGDSNTKYLKFAAGNTQKEKGSFGFLMPGERVEAFHLRDIDPLQCMGYKNVVVHCGINDLRDRSPGRLESDPRPTDIAAHFDVLSKKIEEIKTLCPYAAIFLSPILPTKNMNLNNRAIAFNHILCNFANNNPKGDGIRILNFEPFVSGQGVLREELGVWDQKEECYSKRDMIHLGRKGVTLLAQIIKGAISRKLTTSRSYSATLSHGRLSSPPR